MKILPNSKFSLPTDKLKSWPYWGYGYYGSDGCDWRQYYTNKGLSSIPSYAEEVWPMKQEDMPEGYR